MGKKTEKDIKRAKQEMEVAHQKRMKAIDSVLDRVKSAEEATYQKKMRVLDMAAERMAAGNG